MPRRIPCVSRSATLSGEPRRDRTEVHARAEGTGTATLGTIAVSTGISSIATSTDDQRHAARPPTGPADDA